MNRLNKIIKLLQENNFEVHKDVENPTITISNSRPILDAVRSNVTSSFNFELRAKHENKKRNEKALLEILRLLNADTSFINNKLLEYEEDIDIFTIKYKAPSC